MVIERDLGLVLIHDSPGRGMDQCVLEFTPFRLKAFCYPVPWRSDYVLLPKNWIVV